MDQMKVSDYLTDEGKETLELIKKKAAHNKLKRDIIDQAYDDTQILIKKFRLIEKEYVASPDKSTLSSSAKTMVFMRAVNGVAHAHFKTHVEDISNKLDEEISNLVDKELDKEMEDERHEDTGQE